MQQGTLTIYSASAGSGKTFRLAGIYLAHLFRSKYSYRKILAVTFTNKATAEMKSRILDQLYALAAGDRSEYLHDLIKETHKEEVVIRREAKEILFAILHDFSRFSVCTIDTFFQKVIRAFAREAGLHSGYNIELDHSIILSSAVDETISSSAKNPELAQWLENYVLANLDEEKTWNLKDGIMKLSEELFREKFKILSADETSRLSNKDFLLSYINKLKSIKQLFESKLEKLGKECEELFTSFGLTDDMFYYKSTGIPNYIRSLASGKIIVPNKHVRKIENDPPKWSSGEMNVNLKNALNGGLDKILREILVFYDGNIIQYNSASAILSNIYALGILSDVLKKIHEVATSENSFLISDAGEILSLITQGDQTPFIYEKIGNRFENYMIDEFQDTSFLQWNNFEPLVQNSMGEGNDNLVVGDVKQSIYRFRNSDWQILEQMKEKWIDNKRFISKPLLKNWRSRSNIIRFNNSLFTLIPELIDKKFSDDPAALKFKKIYSEAIQEDPGKETGGYVRLEFVEDKESNETREPDDDLPYCGKWKDIVLDRIPQVIEAFQDKGYSASDIGILVRTSNEGAAVLKAIIEYANNTPARQKSNYNFNIVSNDSLLLSNAHVITFIIAVLKVLDNSGDMISRAEMVRFYHLARGDNDSEASPLFSDKLSGEANPDLPPGYSSFLEKAGKLTLFEAVENIISFFDLGKYPWNVPYLNAFQDIVINYTGSKNPISNRFLNGGTETGAIKISCSAGKPGCG